MFSGGVIAPGCLDPCHDKLAQLKARLGCIESEVPPLEDDDETDSGAAIEDETLPLAAVVEGEADKEPEAEGAKPMKRTRKQKRPLAAAVEREEEERAKAHARGQRL